MRSGDMYVKVPTKVSAAPTLSPTSLTMPKSLTCVEQSRTIYTRVNGQLKWRRGSRAPLK